MSNPVMCLKDTCFLRLNCHRFLSKPEMQQSYGAFENCDLQTNYKSYWAKDKERPANVQCVICGRIV
ncbi:hypothetical protein BJV85_002088 [Clostridium acetobutylicum]|uniref:Uncharacterized protein n=1 Tax=Clostridium acetobutylicum (strain ATCC 824 / DSM 792 / JCM 1419 / IAM 19013 / LMG 5710 / NBRC 13948 / NRRL B-527 / VKM B-1787 / 2291 / W) TaxID=272562 RepID=Q97HV1_CLOAB|nr:MULTISPECIES: hypothetical protein [Bacillota]AAK79869.1 Hypothetical protein CA_C1906 [Clostridium acetobutylicum ATCC 824]ADZ20957.1 Conserved hypothetical protein [Clostridium acetobutylicum EA 2018]AEI32046.1 hypothetical protein SMB_G1933 [Clostridium acetobutylicum DSM 1731]AWV79700.1 hypothetical protein DK921_06220 [Clostridium acetobutylicum]MBC2394323.1 hypothetical protein [Clostridium acetobutylicum]